MNLKSREHMQSYFSGMVKRLCKFNVCGLDMMHAYSQMCCQVGSNVQSVCWS